MRDDVHRRAALAARPRQRTGDGRRHLRLVRLETAGLAPKTGAGSNGGLEGCDQPEAARNFASNETSETTGSMPREVLAASLERDRGFADSPLERSGFELAVPRDTTKVLT